MSGALGIWLPTLRVGSGVDVFAMRLAQGLERAGHRPVLQWFDRGYELTPWRLRRVPAPPDIDIVHAASWQGFAFKRQGLPLVVTEHQYIRHPAFLPHRSLPQTLYHRLFIDLCIERSYRAADALVAVSDHTAEAMRQDMRRPVRRIHNWVDTELFRPAAKPRRTEAEPFKLLFVGNPSRWKGADVLRELAERLGERFEILCLSGLRRSVDTRHAPRNLRLLPSVPFEQVPSIYAQADAVLLPTRYEAFGYVAAEAMACALPVVGFASTGTAEVCIHDQTALLAPMDDVATLADYARELAADPERCERLGRAGRKRVLACFAEAKAIASYEAVYRSVLTKGPRHD